MVGNRRGSVADVQKSHKSTAPYEKKGSHSRAWSRRIPPCEQGSPIVRPRGTINIQKPVNNSSFSGYRNNFQCMNPDLIECNDSANPFSASSSSTILPSEASGAKLKNAEAFFSCTSDESGSDSDMKARMVANPSESQDMESWNRLASSSSEGDSSMLLGGTKCSLTGMRRGNASSLSYGKCIPTRRANVPSSSIRHGLSAGHTSRTCPDKGHSSYSTLHSGRTGWVTLENKGDTSIDRVDMPARGSKLVNQPRQVSGNNAQPEGKRKSSTQPRHSDRLRPWTSNGVGYKEIDKVACNSSTAGSGRISARPHAFAFATDVQSTDMNSSAAMVAEEGFLVENGAGSSGFVNEAGIDTNSYTEFGRRKSSPSGFVGGSSSSTCKHGDNGLVNRRSNTNLPSSSNPNHLSSHTAPNQSRDINLETYSRLSASRHPSFVGGERDMTRRSREKQPMFSSSALSILERPLGFSGPPPARPPPLPPSGSDSTSTENIFVPPSSTTERRLRLASPFTRPSIPDCGQARPSFLTVGTSSHPSTSRSSSEYFQRHPAVEGFSEVLSALERMEREDDLSYEQILMLEATILLGGLGLSDPHRDMRLDVDNMSYEELLALEERIGDVKMGLSEETITKCVRRQVYVAGAMSSTCAADDVSIKCSICQEEFEEGVEVGLLDCTHCHHFPCIKEWLQQKNQCPICKVPASASALQPLLS